MIQQFHLWVYTQKNWKQSQRDIYTTMFIAALWTMWKQTKGLSTNEWIGKCGIYNSDTCYNMGELWGHDTKWNKLVTKKK